MFLILSNIIVFRSLQGHIALDQAVFPENTPGFVLDAFARSSLWKIGLDYRHGNKNHHGALDLQVYSIT